MIAWIVRNIQDGGTGQGEPDAMAIEAERPKLVGIERLLLETVCFDFGLGRQAGGKDVFGYVVAIGRHLRSSSSLIHLAFRLAIDSHRTLVGLTYPPHIIALGCLYLASIFDLSHSQASLTISTSGDQQVDSQQVEPRFEAGWADAFEVELDDIEGILSSHHSLALHHHPFSHLGSYL